MSEHFPNMPYQKQPTQHVCEQTNVPANKKQEWKRSETVASGSTRTNNLNEAVNLEVTISRAKGLNPEQAMPKAAGNALI